MIIKRLEMSAFGPYKGKEVIDFTQFANEVFLIAGDTGAGKTTIFDAVCFALYGQPSGSLRRGDTLRNQDAGKKAESYAEVTFSVRGQDYTVRRQTPELKRPGESASGTASAVLYLPDGTVQKKNVKQTVAEITGFDRESFLRVSVLPQGEFDKFLTAKTSERQDTLRRIFSTHLYQNYADVVKEWSKSVNRQLEDLSKRYSAAVQAVFPEEQQFPLSGAEDKSRELAELIAKAAEEQRSAEQSGEDLTAELIQNSRLRSEAQEQNKALELYAAAKSEKEKLDLQSEIYSGKREILERQKRAEEARPELSGRDNAAAQHKSAQAEAVAAELREKQTAGALAEARKADEEAKQLDGELKGITGELPQLAELLERCRKAQESEREVKRLEASMSEKQERLTGNQAAQQTCSDQIKLLTQQTNECRTLAAQRGGAESQLNAAAASMKHAEQLLKDLEALDRLAEEHQAAAKDCESTQTVLDKAQSDNEQLNLRYFAGEAARLAKKLETGVACPVCGSTEHPFPAPWAENIPTEADLKKSEKALNAAQKARSAADKALSGISGQLESSREAAAREYAEVIGGEIPQSGAAEAVREKSQQLIDSEKALKMALDDCVAAENRLPELSARLEQEEKRLGELVQEQQDIANEISALNSAIAAKVKEAEFNRQGLEGRTAAQLTQEISGKRARAAEIESTRQTAAEALARAEKEAASAAARLEQLKKTLADSAVGLDKAQSALEEKLRTCGFGGEQELRQYLADKQQRSSLEKEIADYNERQTAAAATLEERGKALPENRELLDISQFDEKERGLKAEQSVISSQIKQLTARITGLSAAKDNVDGMIRSAVQLSNTQKTLTKLDRVINGSGESRISFETFIQMRMFAGVLEEANKRLVTLSGGRYRFALREEGMRANSAAGLDIDIIDNNSGSAARRDVSTMSGGERFLASFALAIGLSDYTLRRGAGRSADMLLIDEGFSTLSRDVFDEALAVIEQLRENDRTVGIITHVEGIQEYFRNMQIQVIKNKDGSTTRTICRK
ncbi:MAG: AAA family ATPase [Oscillospiraceae bacterium]